MPSCGLHLDEGKRVPEGQLDTSLIPGLELVKVLVGLQNLTSHLVLIRYLESIYIYEFKYK